MGQYAGGFDGGQQAGPMGAGQPDPNSFVSDALNQIADQLSKVAQVLAQTRPETLVMIQKMAEAGSMLQQAISGDGMQAGQEGGVQSPPQPAGPQDVPMA
jgi:hypothetical protein